MNLCLNLKFLSKESQVQTKLVYIFRHEWVNHMHTHSGYVASWWYDICYQLIQVNLDMTDHCTTDFCIWRTICLVPVRWISSIRHMYTTDFAYDGPIFLVPLSPSYPSSPVVSMEAMSGWYLREIDIRVRIDCTKQLISCNIGFTFLIKFWSNFVQIFEEKILIITKPTIVIQT